MAYIIHLQTHTDARGSLTVIDKELPFEVKRVFYIYNSSGLPRGGHQHHASAEALICIKGRCTVNIEKGVTGESFSLETPDTCMILDPSDWHTLSDFSKDSILLVLASEHYDSSDYAAKELADRV